MLRKRDYLATFPTEEYLEGEIRGMGLTPMKGQKEHV